MSEKRQQAADYLGMPLERIAMLPQPVIDAVTTDDLGTVPPDFLESPLWEVMTDQDREELLRFRLFLGAMGKAPV